MVAAAEWHAPRASARTHLKLAAIGDFKWRSKLFDSSRERGVCGHNKADASAGTGHSQWVGTESPKKKI